MFITKRNNGIYYIYYNDESGKRKAQSTNTKLKSKALLYLSNFSAELKERKELYIIPIVLSRFFFEFLQYSESVHSWNHTISLRVTFKAFMMHCGNISLSDLNKEKMISYFEERLRRVSNYTVKRDIANLSSSFTYAVSKKYLSNNLCAGIKKPRIIERLPLFFSEAEFQTLLSVVKDKDLRDIIIFAVNTGLRQSDLINLEWRQINLENRSLILDNRNSRTKSGKVHSIPLNEKAMQILAERKLTQTKNTRVFLYQSKVMKQYFISQTFKKLVRRS